MSRTIIFDFDGTLADTFEESFQTLRELAIQHGYDPVGREQLAAFRDMPPMDIIKELDIPMTRLPFIIKDFRKQVAAKVHVAKAFDGIKEIVIELRNRGNNLGILTSNSETTVADFIHDRDMGVFDFIYDKASVFGKTKLLKDIIYKFELEKENTYYIGDEIRDVEAANKVPMPVVAVTWGFSTERLLKTGNPTHVAKKPSDLLQIFS